MKFRTCKEEEVLVVAKPLIGTGLKSNLDRRQVQPAPGCVLNTHTVGYIHCFLPHWRVSWFVQLYNTLTFIDKTASLLKLCLSRNWSTYEICAQPPHSAPVRRLHRTLGLLTRKKHKQEKNKTWSVMKHLLFSLQHIQEGESEKH